MLPESLPSDNSTSEGTSGDTPLPSDNSNPLLSDDKDATGDDGSGDPHSPIEIEAAAFAGVGRLERQRMVNRALGDIPGQRVHALAIKAKAPGE